MYLIVNHQLFMVKIDQPPGNAGDVFPASPSHRARSSTLHSRSAPGRRSCGTSGWTNAGATGSALRNGSPRGLDKAWVVWDVGGLVGAELGVLQIGSLGVVERQISRATSMLRS